MIEFRKVGKVYKNEVHALRGVSFRIEAGEFVFFIGESGAGKSTLIKLLTCEERPSSGTVVLDQYDVSRMQRKLVPFLRRKIGMIFQDFRLIESKTVEENVAFAMEIVGAPQRVIKRRVPIVLSVVGLRHKSKAYPQELSGGEAQRVGIARAMVNNPRLILADEPTGNLDPANSEAIMALLEEINRAGTTIIACTHDVNLVNRMRKRVIQLENGFVVRDEQGSGYLTETDPACFNGISDSGELASLLNQAQDNEAYDDDDGADLEDRYAADMSLGAGVPVDLLRDKMADDASKRQNRKSLAERIAKMRIAAEDACRVQENGNMSTDNEAVKDVSQEEPKENSDAQ